jgi:TRAP-type C4-dicarboxylate transport system substrate-binding protein
VLKAIEEKSEKAKQLQTLLNENLNQKYRENINAGKVEIVKPSFV